MPEPIDFGNYSYLVTPKDVYGDAAITLRGYVVVTFAVPSMGDLFVEKSGTVVTCNRLWNTNNPRFIVRRKPRLVCDDTTPRVPKEGDIVFLTDDTNHAKTRQHVVKGYESFVNQHICFRREEYA